MGVAYFISMMGLDDVMRVTIDTHKLIGGVMTDGKMVIEGGSIFAFGLVAFGFLCMGPVNIAVDSYGR